MPVVSLAESTKGGLGRYAGFPPAFAIDFVA